VGGGGGESARERERAREIERGERERAGGEWALRGSEAGVRKGGRKAETQRGACDSDGGSDVSAGGR